MLMFLLVLLLPLLLFLIIHHLLSEHGKLPPGPTFRRLWRNRSLFAKSPHVALKELAGTYGPLLSFRVGCQLVVVASSPAMAEEIFKRNSLSLSGRFIPSLYYSVPGAKNASMATARDCDDSWKFLRRISQSFIFSSKAMESAAALRRTKVAEMMRLLSMQGERAVNVERSFYAAFSNIVANVLASMDMFECGGVGPRDEMVMRFLDEIVEKATVPGLVDVFPILRGVDFWSRATSMEIYRHVKLIWGDVISERRASVDELNSKRDFLSILIGHSFDDDQIAFLLTVRTYMYMYTSSASALRRREVTALADGVMEEVSSESGRE